jgi:hypothetical protein
MSLRPTGFFMLTRFPVFNKPCCHARTILAAAIAAVFAVSPALAQHGHPTQPDSAHHKPVRDSSAKSPPPSGMRGMKGMSTHKDTATSSMPGMSMGAAPLGIPMQRMGSGTSWVPDATTMHASHLMLGAWDVMLHGVAFLQYDDQGTRRGDRQFGSVNWGMLMAGRDLAGGRLALRGMMSAEPFTVGSRGYPLLLQSGESYHGQSLYDRQHPHDLFMEMAAMYDHAIGDNLAVSLYAAPVGEPAIGPVAFPHRPSAANDPLAPIGHHWQDATHISFGVITGGIYTRTVRLEGSIFNGREPDEIRTNFDYKGRSLDSYAGRLTINPNKYWSVSGSYAYLKSPEQLHPAESLHRISASVLYELPFRTSGDWASALIYGANKHTGQTSLSNSLLAESNLSLDHNNTLFTRAEFVQKGPEDLPTSVAMNPNPAVAQGMHESAIVITKLPAPIQYDVGEVTLGYVRELVSVYSGSLGLGTAGTINVIPSILKDTYGTRTPMGITVFLRLRPGPMHTGAHSAIR